MGLILGTQLLAANVTQPYPDHGLKRTPIKVALLSLPPRTQSLLEFFFTNAGRGSFMACTEEQAETAIFDLDTPASRDHWLIFNARTGCPGIALAVKPQDVPGALWVQKPVTPAALLAAAASLRAAASAPPPERVMPLPATLTPESPPAVPEAATLSTAEPVAPAAAVQPLPAAIAPIDTEAKRPPVAPDPTHEEARVHPPAQPAPAMPEPAAAPIPEATPQPAATAAEPTDTAVAAPSSHSEPTVAPASVPAAARPVSPSPEADTGGKSFWQRWFGTAGRKPAVPPSPRATVETASPSAPVAQDLAALAEAAEKSVPAAASNEPVLPEAVTPSAAEQSPTPAVEEAQASAPAPQSLGVDAHQPRETTTGVVADEPTALATAEADQPAADAADASEADEATTVASGFLPTEPSPPPSGISEERSAADAAPSDSAGEALFGSRADVPAKELAESATLRFDPEKYLVGVLREAFMVATKWEVPTQFDCGAGFLVVDAERNELHSSLDDAELQALASTPLTKRSKVQTLSNLDYVRFKRALQDSGKARCTRLDDAIWRAAMWGSAGRLPAGTNPTRTIFLRQWPNLTRITPVPQGPRLAALWALRGGTVLDSCKQFNLPQRHVIGFYNGVWALNLLTEDGSFARRTQRKGARNRGLLTRLLGWLRR